MKYPTTKDTAQLVREIMAKAKMTSTETFDSFAKRLRSMYRRVTAAGEPYDESFLVRCFLLGLDDNFEPTRIVNTNGSLRWEDHDLDSCVQTAFGMKLKLQSQNGWKTITTSAKGNAEAGQHGPSRPTDTSVTDNKKQPRTPYNHHWTGKKELSAKEVSILLGRHSCICCRSNNHELTTCPVLTKTYNVSYKQSSQRQSTTTGNT